MFAYPHIQYGGDPEIFIESDGRIIGSEHVVPEKGEEAPHARSDRGAKIIRDGVQVEINLTPCSCRAGMGDGLSVAFKRLKELLKDNQKVSFKGVVEIEKSEIERLSPASRRLGCAPSGNAHDANATIGVDPATYMTRSAGGHIHLGLNPYADYRWPKEKIISIVPILDILLGNTCVLIDRDPLAAKRREVYGRAGEYRLPSHGLEYRTLSNFWLRHYALVGMVYGLAKTAVCVVDHGLNNTLLSLVDLKDIVRAINTNDFDLAKANLDRIRPFIEREMDDDGVENSIYFTWPLTKKKLEDFDYFLTKPVEEWFPMDPFEYWTQTYVGDYNAKGMYDEHGMWRGAPIEQQKAVDHGHYTGWETFLTEVVRPQRLAQAGVIANQQSGQQQGAESEQRL